MNPYNDIRLNRQTLLREFNSRIDDIEYTWHRDEDDRLIEVFNGTGWELQLDNQLPVLLESGRKYYIPAGAWHRLHKGFDNLTILITEKGHKKTPKYDDHPALKGKQTKLPDGLQKGIISKSKKENIEEKEVDEFVETLEERKKKRKKRKKTKPSKNPQYAKGRSASNKAGLDAAVAAYNRAKKTPGKADDLAAIKKREMYAESKEMDRETMREYIEEIIEARKLYQAIEEEYMREDASYDDINEKKKKKKKKKKSGARTLSKAVKKSLDKKADRRCLTRGSVYAEFRAGLGAYYTSGSRKGMSAHQWAHARVNSANPSKSWAKVKKRKKCPKKKKKK
jgi:hypothetical protein